MTVAQTGALAISILISFAVMARAGELPDSAALAAAAQSWVEAYNARDAEAMSALVTDDVVLLNPDAPPVVGRDAVRKAWQQVMSRGGPPVKVAVSETVIAGDFAWTIVAYSQQMPDRSVASRGQSLENWKRVDGHWRMHRHMTAGILAQPGLRPRPAPLEPTVDGPID